MGIKQKKEKKKSKKNSNKNSKKNSKWPTQKTEIIKTANSHNFLQQFQELVLGLRITDWCEGH